MTYQVNAWLERRDPRLQVTDKRNGQVLLDWGAEQVRALLESGELCAEDFRREADLQQQVRELFLRGTVDRYAQGSQR